jgi:hypothetical protein
MKDSSPNAMKVFTGKLKSSGHAIRDWQQMRPDVPLKCAVEPSNSPGKLLEGL